MKLAFRTILAARTFATNASIVQKSESSVPLTSEFFEHIRYQVYGDARKVDKVVINVNQDEEMTAVLVNRNVSTPYTCLNHISKQFADDAILVEVSPDVGSSYISSVNQPIRDKAQIRKIPFDDQDFATLANEAYWRSCGLVTSAILKDSLNCEIRTENVENGLEDGYFSLKIDGLTGSLSGDELNAINKYAKVFLRDNHLFEVLSVPEDVAFENGVQSLNLVRVGEHVFGSNGPVISSTNQIGRFTILKPRISKPYQLIAGVSVPYSQPTSSYSWGLIVKNAIFKFQQQNL